MRVLAHLRLRSGPGRLGRAAADSRARAHLAGCARCSDLHQRYRRVDGLVAADLAAAPWSPVADRVWATLQQQQAAPGARLWARRASRALGPAVQVGMLVVLLGTLAVLLRSGLGSGSVPAADDATTSPASAPAPADALEEPWGILPRPSPSAVASPSPRPLARPPAGTPALTLPASVQDVRPDARTERGSGPPAGQVWGSERVSTPNAAEVRAIPEHVLGPGEASRWGEGDGRAVRLVSGVSIDVRVVWQPAGGRPLEVVLEDVHSGDLVATTCTSAAGSCRAQLPVPATGDYAVRLRALGPDSLTVLAQVQWPLLDTAWHADPGLAAVTQAGLVRQVGLMETHAGSTITLERAYADASRMVLTFTVRRPQAGQTVRSVGLAHTTVQLTDAGGHTYALQPAGGGTIDFGGDGTTPDVENLGFDTSVLPASGGPMDAEVSLTDLTGWRVTGGRPQSEVLARGPWHFRFPLLVQPRQEVEPHQVVTSGGITVGLERVLVAPSQTTVWLRWTPPADQRYAGWEPIVNLDGPGYVSGGARGIGEVAPGLWQTTFFSPPVEPGAEWQVRVSELVGFVRGDDQPAQRCQGLEGPCPSMADGTHGQRRLSGPWVLRFRLP